MKSVLEVDVLEGGTTGKNKAGFTQQYASNAAPITLVFRLPFFGMEITWVSIDAAEFSNADFKTKSRYPKNINS